MNKPLPLTVIAEHKDFYVIEKPAGLNFHSEEGPGFVVLAGGAVQLSSFNAWAAKKSAIDNHVAKTLLLVGKDMFPGKRFSDDLYMIAVDSLDSKASKDESLKISLTDGVAEFDKVAGGKYIKASSKKRMNVLKSMEGKGLFNSVNFCLSNVISSPLVNALTGTISVHTEFL